VEASETEPVGHTCSLQLVKRTKSRHCMPEAERLEAFENGACGAHLLFKVQITFNDL